jgi:hypothetical protein
MNLISNILGKILPHHHQDVVNPEAISANAVPESIAAPDSTSESAPQQVDVMQILGSMAEQNSEKLNWKTSIVDLMKLLDMDSSLAARKQLAKELNFDGDTSDTANMNMWLQREVMQKLAENGGAVPQEILH